MSKVKNMQHRFQVPPRRKRKKKKKKEKYKSKICLLDLTKSQIYMGDRNEDLAQTIVTMEGSRSMKNAFGGNGKRVESDILGLKLRFSDRLLPGRNKDARRQWHAFEATDRTIGDLVRDIRTKYGLRRNFSVIRDLHELGADLTAALLRDGDCLFLEETTPLPKPAAAEDACCQGCGIRDARRLSQR